MPVRLQLLHTVRVAVEERLTALMTSPVLKGKLAFHVLWPMAAGLGCGLAVAALRHWELVPALVMTNSVPPETRMAFWAHAWTGLLLGPVLIAVLGRARPLHLEFRGSGTPWIWFVLPLSSTPYLCHLGLWQRSPVFMQLAAAGVAGGTSLMLFRRQGESAPKAQPTEPEEPAKRWLVAVGLAVVAYASYVTVQQARHHYSLGTHAYDMGIMENVFWNSVHGDLFGSSIEHEGNHLGVHTSFIYLPFFLVYALIPRTETLLAIQALAVGAAAIPLFLLALRLGLSNRAAALLALIYLTHPGIGGANFYDFHELAFLPILYFGAFLFWIDEKPLLFWSSIVALLSVKEDMSIVVASIGLFLLFSSQVARGLKLALLGGVAYVCLQKIVIARFAGGAHSFAWYYAEMIPGDEGPFGLVKTMVINPLYALKYPFSEQKILYLLQMLAPLAFLPVLRWRGGLLVIYGLVVSLFSNRGPLFELGFQYAFLLLAPAFVAALLALRDLAPWTRRRFLTTAGLLATVGVVHYGFIYPRHQFKAGFGSVDLTFSLEEKDRYEELQELIALIPPDASVTANEEVVPHVATRKKVETLRYAHSNAGRAYDYYLLLNNHGTRSQLAREYPEVATLEAYEVVEARTYLTLLRRRPLGGRDDT
jgi:uncharacterized membrane protein